MMQRNKRIGLLLLTFIFGVHAAGAGAQTKAAFEKLKSLSGEWEGKDADGMEAKTNFKVIVNGTTVMETLVAMHMEEMVTLYNVDGDSISLIHYCPTNNQPRMRASISSSFILRTTITSLKSGLGARMGRIHR
jgi:hypothetical protein